MFLSCTSTEDGFCITIERYIQDILMNKEKSVEIIMPFSDYIPAIIDQFTKLINKIKGLEI